MSNIANASHRDCVVWIRVEVLFKSPKALTCYQISWVFHEEIWKWIKILYLDNIKFKIKIANVETPTSRVYALLGVTVRKIFVLELSKKQALWQIFVNKSTAARQPSQIKGHIYCHSNCLKSTHFFFLSKGKIWIV